MSARIRIRVLCMGLPLVALLAGCGNYTITFEAGDVINAWGDDITAEMLDVDILCLTKDMAEKHPAIVQGTLKADQWFKMRDEDDPALGDIPASCVYALRFGNPGDRRDTLVGQPLLSFRDRRDGQRTTVVKIKHPDASKRESAIVIYGKFSDRDGVARTAPLIIQPPPSWNDKITIKIGRRGMSRAE